jgi:hypothetical protein
MNIRKQKDRVSGLFVLYERFFGFEEHNPSTHREGLSTT